MAQGRLEKVQMSLDGLQPGALQLRGLVAGKPAMTADAGEHPAVGAKPARTAPRSGGGAQPAKPSADDKW